MLKQIGDLLHYINLALVEVFMVLQTNFGETVGYQY